jgi:rubrerythrin
MTTRAFTPERSRDQQSQTATHALFTTELAAWRCVRCGSVCCVGHAQPSVCARCGTRYVLHT